MQLSTGLEGTMPTAYHECIRIARAVMESLPIKVSSVVQGTQTQSDHCCLFCVGKGKGKATPVQAWTGPEGSTELRLPDFMTVVT